MEQGVGASAPLENKYTGWLLRIYFSEKIIDNDKTCMGSIFVDMFLNL